MQYQIVTETGCWIWDSAISGDGYGYMRVNGRNMSSHRASWIFHNGHIPKKLCVCHKCDTTLCVNPLHLFLGTQLENMQDMMRKGRRRGKRCSVMSSDKWFSMANEILKSHGAQSQIALTFGVSIGTVNNIKRKRGIYSTLEI